jgi:hypothetical protein
MVIPAVKFRLFSKKNMVIPAACMYLVLEDIGMVPSIVKLAVPAHRSSLQIRVEFQVDYRDPQISARRYQIKHRSWKESTSAAELEGVWSGGGAAVTFCRVMRRDETRRRLRIYK